MGTSGNRWGRAKTQAQSPMHLASLKEWLLLPHEQRRRNGEHRSSLWKSRTWQPSNRAAPSVWPRLAAQNCSRAMLAAPSLRGGTLMTRLSDASSSRLAASRRYETTSFTCCGQRQMVMKKTTNHHEIEDLWHNDSQMVNMKSASWMV